MTADPTRKLHLIDGNSLAYRAFFALPDTFINSKGRPTNALFGLAGMFIKVLEEHDYPPTICVWDAGLSGREVLYEPYKAQRDERPEPLSEQFPFFIPLAEAFGFCNVKVPGWEADDVIATLAEQAVDKGMEVVVVTGDRDALQLVSDKVTIMATARGITDTKLYSPDAVFERYGVTPEQIPDFIGLKGDTSDNIPGVPGIGEKTAATLLQEFGTVEAVLENIDKIPGAKRKENLTNYADDARISKQLATAHRNIDTGFDVQEAFDRSFDFAQLRDCLMELELREPLRRLERMIARSGGRDGDGGGSLAGQGVVAGKTESFTSSGKGSDVKSDELQAEAEHSDPVKEAPVHVKNVELSALTDLPDEPLVLLVKSTSMADEPAESLLADAELHSATESTLFAAVAPDATVLRGEATTPDEVLRAWGSRPLITHDLKAAFGPSSADAPLLQHDTMIAAYLLNSARRDYTVAGLAREAGLPDYTQAADPLAGEAAIVAELAKWQRTQIEQLGLASLFNEVELPLVQILAGMERDGVKLDTERLAAMGTELAAEIATLEVEIYDLAGRPFTIGSPKQLSEVLFVDLALATGRKGKTGYSTDAKVLRSLRDKHPVIEKVERWRELVKLMNTYVEALPRAVSPVDGRLHTTFNQAGAATGRLSSVNPNLQNIPIRTPLGARIRECFVAEDGCVLTSADYSQVELRVLAHVSGDTAMQEIFRRGEDVHSATAAEVFGADAAAVDPGMRSRAKAVNFGIIYGLSAFGLAEQLQIPRAEAAEYIKLYMSRFPGVQQFIEQTVADAKQNQFVTTLFGRRRAIPELASSQAHIRQAGERLAVNSVLQGTAADIIKVAMIRCAKALTEADIRSRLILQIHDELLFEGPVDEAEAVRALACREMVAAYELEPPLAVDAGSGPDWLSAK